MKYFVQLVCQKVKSYPEKCDEFSPFVFRANFRAGLENVANFLSLFLERIFALGSKMRRIFSLCFSEITLETSRNDARIFERNFVESSQGQRTKFAHFALITFSQYCIFAIVGTSRITLIPFTLFFNGGTYNRPPFKSVLF